MRSKSGYGVVIWDQRGRLESAPIREDRRWRRRPGVAPLGPPGRSRVGPLQIASERSSQTGACWSRPDEAGRSRRSHKRAPGMTDWPPGAPGVSVLGIRVGSAGAHGIRQRARRQHTGRSTCCMGSRTRQEPAQSDDLHFYGERGQQNSVARAQHLLVRIHLLSGRTEQAMAALQKSLGAGVEEHAVLEALCTAHRQAGRDVAARLAAQQLRHRDQAAGLSSLALTVEVYDSTRSARPWWHAAEQATRLAWPLLRRTAPAQHRHPCSTPPLDGRGHRTRPLADPVPPLERAGRHPAELLRASGSDRARLAPRLTAITAAEKPSKPATRNRPGPNLISMPHCDPGPTVWSAPAWQRSGSLAAAQAAPLWPTARVHRPLLHHPCGTADRPATG